MNAREILTQSFGDLGIVSANAPMTPEMASDGLKRLNNMVSSWRTQFGTVLAVERTIFPIVADKQTYTIGLGGDFNVPKPVTIPAAGLWLAGLADAESVTSITRSGTVATVTQTAHPFAVGDEAYISGAAQIGYNGLQTVQTVPSANSYTFTVGNTVTTPATGTITAAAVEDQPVEIPRAVITDDAYQAIQIKNLSNSLFTVVYYNSTSTNSPFGTVFLWPRPDTAANQLVLYLQSAFVTFAALLTDYDWPDNPGYAEALQYQLDLRLAPAYGQQASPEIVELARETFGCIKRANNKLVDLPTDAHVLAWSRRSGYNIQTGQGG
jgi:hypothetical protein